MKQLPRSWDAGANLIIGNRIPKDYFITKGRGESDITFHAGSYHLALKEAGIESYNIMTYSSILPGVARLVKKPQSYTHGSVMETIMSVCNMVGAAREARPVSSMVGCMIKKPSKNMAVLCVNAAAISAKLKRNISSRPV